MEKYCEYGSSIILLLIRPRAPLYYFLKLPKTSKNIKKPRYRRILKIFFRIFKNTNGYKNIFANIHFLRNNNGAKQKAQKGLRKKCQRYPPRSQIERSGR
nr:MAG TPA: hypothetical protein [Caudoviricetes sp.]